MCDSPSITAPIPPSARSQRQLRLLLNLSVPARLLRNVHVRIHRKPCAVERVRSGLQRQFVATFPVHAPETSNSKLSGSLLLHVVGAEKIEGTLRETLRRDLAVPLRQVAPDGGAPDVLCGP